MICTVFTTVLNVYHSSIALYQFVVIIGSLNRHLGQYEKSIKSLTQALDEKDHLKPTEVADMLKEFCSTIPSYGEYMESR